MAKKALPKMYLNVITVVPGPSLRESGESGYETLRDTVEGTLRDDDLLAEFRFPEGITNTDMIGMLHAAAEDLQLQQVGRKLPRDDVRETAEELVAQARGEAFNKFMAEMGRLDPQGSVSESVKAFRAAWSRCGVDT
jgi:hypothetical protein